MKVEDFPTAFGKTEEEFKALKPWSRKSLLQKAKLF